MRRAWVFLGAVAAFTLMWPVLGSGATTTTTTSVPVACPPNSDPASTTIPIPGCVILPATTTTTTTTTLPVAATTVPEGCALPPTAQAVFIGEVTAIDPVAAVFRVSQVRAGSLDGYLVNDSVEVRYGSDAKYLSVGSQYIVGAEQDSVTLRLTSTVRDTPELFGGAEVTGSRARCPEFEAAARTLNIDGSAIAAGMFTTLFDEPWRLALSVLAPPVLVFVALFAAVWFRRGLKRV